MIKAILFDGDGVTIKTHPFFTKVSSKKYTLPLEKIEVFFKTKFKDCQRGKMDLKVEIEPYLKDWGWTKGVDEYLKEWFESEADAEERVLSLVKDLRARGIKCYLATDQDRYRGEFITNNMNFKEYFDGEFYSYQIGHSKSEPEFFQAILQKLNLQPSEVMYWDDDPKNVEVAKALGMDARFYEKFKNLKDASR